MKVVLALSNMTGLLHLKNYCEKTALMEDFPLSKGYLNYNIKHQLDFSVRPVKSVYYGTESFAYLEL